MLIKTLQAIRLLTFFANRLSSVRSFIGDANSTISFAIRDEEPFFVEISSGKLTVVDGKPADPDATIQTDSSTFFRVLAGALTQEEAFDLRKIEVTGSIFDALRLRYIVNQVEQESIFVKLLTRMLSAARIFI